MPWDRNRPRSGDYGWDWIKVRREWAARHHPEDPCVRCGHELGPMNRWLHLDHDDHDRRIVRGFAHGAPCPTCGVRCNVVAGARAARAAQNVTRIEL